MALSGTLHIGGRVVQGPGPGIANTFVVYNCQGDFLCTLRVCTLGFGSLIHGRWSLNKGIWDPKSRVANIKGANLKSLRLYLLGA